MPISAPEFDPTTLPWADRDDFETQLATRIGSGHLSEVDAERLRRWHADGFVILRGAVEPELLEAVWEDLEHARRDAAVCYATVEGRGVVPLAELPDEEELRRIHHHYRVMDFHNVSRAAKLVSLHPAVLSFVRLLFEGEPVAMQSLLFERGTEQRWHQDFPFVCSGIPSHLAAAWVACEDVDEAAGPLEYYRGSHRIPKHDWGGGSLVHARPEDEQAVLRFEAYLEQTCEALSLPVERFSARRGDVVLWHAALVHRGSVVRDRQRSRRSYVSHYSSVRAYPRDRRAPDAEPAVIRVAGGLCYAAPFPGHVEDRYPYPR